MARVFLPPLELATRDEEDASGPSSVDAPRDRSAGRVLGVDFMSDALYEIRRFRTLNILRKHPSMRGAPLWMSVQDVSDIMKLEHTPTGHPLFP